MGRNFIDGVDVGNDVAGFVGTLEDGRMNEGIPPKRVDAPISKIDAGNSPNQKSQTSSSTLKAHGILLHPRERLTPVLPQKGVALCL